MKIKLSLSEIVLFAMLGALTFSAQVVMEAFPNIHLSGMFTILYTVLFRKKALIPIYLYVFLIGVRWGFGLAWLPYLYVWLVLWGAVMLVPHGFSEKKRGVLYLAIGALHGFSFGLLYAPAQALLFGLNGKQTLAWIVSGLPWDAMHGVGNALFCALVLPLSRRLQKRIK